MSDLMLDVDQAGELKAAFRRGDWTNAEIKKACEGDVLANFRDVLLGRAQIVWTQETAQKVRTFRALKSVTSDGRSGKEFVKDLKKKGFNVGDWATNVMTVGKDASGKAIIVSDSGVVYKPVVLKGEDFTDAERVTSNIRKVAEEMKLVTPPWWLAPLLREAMTDAEIAAFGLTWLIVMHEAITDSDGDPRLLGLDRDGGGRWLGACRGRPDYGWDREDGFVFLAPQE
jgi:hypothetical protein